MSYYFNNLQPNYDSDDEEVNEMDLGETLKKVIKRKNHHGKEDREEEDDGDENEDEMQTLSVGSLKKADNLLAKEEKQSRQQRQQAKKATAALKLIEKKGRTKDKPEDKKKLYKEESFDESDSDSDSEGAFFEEEEEEQNDRRSNHNQNKSNKRHKHAPAESSSKKRVSRIREIPGLEQPSNRNSRLYGDIRFDKAMGAIDTDSSVIRRRYAFLDEYREKEIADMERMLHDRKFLSKVSEHDKFEMEGRLKSMKSRLQSIKNKELETKIVKDYETQMNENNKSRYHLKESEKRKVIQKWKFDHMKAKQREKVMERKRKKRLGKEFKQFEFHNRDK